MFRRKSKAVLVLQDGRRLAADSPLISDQLRRHEDAALEADPTTGVGTCESVWSDGKRITIDGFVRMTQDKIWILAEKNGQRANQPPKPLEAATAYEVTGDADERLMVYVDGRPDYLMIYEFQPTDVHACVELLVAAGVPTKG